MTEEKLLNLFSDGVPSYKHGNDAVKAQARSKTSEVLVIIKARDDRRVAELETLKREDIDTWRSWNQAIDTAIKVIRNTK